MLPSIPNVSPFRFCPKSNLFGFDHYNSLKSFSIIYDKVDVTKFIIYSSFYLR
jgi:hypothetical protein